jgi:high-affinity iron transporter
VFNSLFGWQNSATIGSVVSYCLYWVVVIVAFLAMGYNERRGHWPFMKAKANTHTTTAVRHESASDSSTAGEKVAEKTGSVSQPSSNVREVQH